MKNIKKSDSPNERVAERGEGRGESRTRIDFKPHLRRFQNWAFLGGARRSRPRAGFRKWATRLCNLKLSSRSHGLAPASAKIQDCLGKIFVIGLGRSLSFFFTSYPDSTLNFASTRISGYKQIEPTFSISEQVFESMILPTDRILCRTEGQTPFRPQPCREWRLRSGQPSHPPNLFIYLRRVSGEA